MSQTWQKRRKEMKIRFVGLLTEAQVAKGLAGYKTIEPSEGIFIKGGLTYTFTFKKDVVIGVTIRRAPRITLLDETDAETPAPKELCLNQNKK